MCYYLYTLDYNDGEEGSDNEGSEDDHLAMPLRTRASTEHLSSEDNISQEMIKTSGNDSRDQVTTPATSPEPNEKVTALQAKVMSNVHVYAKAEKYEIPALKELAKAKFRALLSSDQWICRYQDIIAAVFETTPETDSGLDYVILLSRIVPSKLTPCCRVQNFATKFKSMVTLASA